MDQWMKNINKIPFHSLLLEFILFVYCTIFFCWISSILCVIFSHYFFPFLLFNYEYFSLFFHKLICHLFHWFIYYVFGCTLILFFLNVNLIYYFLVLFVTSGGNVVHYLETLNSITCRSDGLNASLLPKHFSKDLIFILLSNSHV